MTTTSAFKLIPYVDEQLKGIIWVTKKGQIIDSPYFTEINYLFDGLLAKHLRFLQNNDKKTEKKLPFHFYLTTLYKRPFVMANFNYGTQNFLDNLENIQKILDGIKSQAQQKNTSQQKHKILIIPESNTDEISQQINKVRESDNFQLEVDLPNDFQNL